mgnify:FL=1
MCEIKNLLGFPSDKDEYSKKKYHEVLLVENRRNLSPHIRKCSDFDMDKSAEDRHAPEVLPNKIIVTSIGILKENIERVCIIYRTTTSGVDELYDELFPPPDVCQSPPSFPKG